MLQRGQRLLIRVSDPGKLLPAPVGRNAGNHVFIAITNSSGIQHKIPLNSTDSGGRTHIIAIPNNENHKLSIRSSSFSLSDGQGRAIDPEKPALILATPSAALATVVVNISTPAVKP